MNEEKARNVEKLWTAEFIGMSATNFFHLMAQYILIVGLPIYIMNEMKGGELEAGLAMTFFQIGAVSSRPFAGRLIDSLHKGRLLFGATLASSFLRRAPFSHFGSQTAGSSPMRSLCQKRKKAGDSPL